MKHIVCAVFIALIFLGVPAFADRNDDPSALENGELLMVIRFNQENIYYQMPLYKTVKKALQIYPNASFQILSVIPTTGNYKTDENSANLVAEYSSLIVNSLEEMGLPKARLRTNYTSGSDLQYPEVRIFVR